MNRLNLMITVTERQREKSFAKVYDSLGIATQLIFHGHGTATNAVLDSFGLEASPKSVLLGIVTDRTFTAARRELERRFQIDIPGTGIAFTVPLGAVGGKNTLSFFIAEQDYQVSEETELKNTEQELLIAIANQGYAEAVMDAARSAGARGGTIIHAKGTGIEKAEAFFGINLASEKELVLIVVRTADRDAIMRAIMDGTGLRSEAQAVCFSLPVTATAGMRLMQQTPEEDAEDEVLP